MLDVCHQQTDLATENVCWGKIAFPAVGKDNGGMVKRPTKPTGMSTPAKRTRVGKPKLSRPAQDAEGDPPRPNEILHLGGWIAAKRLKQAHVARDSGYTRSYINNLINPTKKKHRNPSALMVLRISRAMKMTVNELYEPPPPKAALDQLRRLQPETIRSLIDAGN